jgi:hypothetical protein
MIDTLCTCQVKALTRIQRELEGAAAKHLPAIEACSMVQQAVELFIRNRSCSVDEGLEVDEVFENGFSFFLGAVVEDLG